ncbi:chorismate-binding protein [Rhizobacter sp. Root404]|uniref:chorismate-binding protein n=1 Tax=Rhizobacter sp. Root404 TaxID=1736528 RepID=UPI0009EB038E|nr:chorismate-binding protein [Rhizobacter sp. Root404]
MKTELVIDSVPADLDPVSLMEALSVNDGLLFERFDPRTRARSHTTLVLRWTRSPGENLRDALVLASRRADSDHLLHVIVLGSAGGKGIKLSDRWLADAWFVAHADESIEIDWETGRLVHRWPAKDVPITQTLERDIARCSRAATSQSVARGDAATTWQPEVDSAEYLARVREVQRGLNERGIHGAVLSLGQTRVTEAPPKNIYREMVRQNPSTYGYCFRLGNLSLVGSSPLTYLKLDKNNVILETDAGTRPIAGDAARDEEALRDLQTNPKDAAEHQIVVDAEMQALRPLALGGHIAKLKDREVRRFSHVMHLYTVLQAHLKPELEFSDALVGVFPPAAVSGYPKQEAWALGNEIEGGERGPYGGVIGLLRADSNAEFAVIIRSLWMQGNQAAIRTGGKIVPGSDPSSEHREALAKARFLIESLDRVEQSLASES